jgi:4-diphosphocytidyl-2-C-methyl-D-erythritol kinase
VDISVAEYEQITRVGEAVKVLAPAKINLSLLVAGKRPDGFHELETIMAKISLFDELLIEPGTGTGIELVCRGPQWVPQGEENLVYKAAELILKTGYQTEDRGRRTEGGGQPTKGIKLTLTKNIPAGSGLGGASTDAAATLIGVNEFLQLGLDRGRLAELAAELSSDAAFFLGGPLAFCTGRGEKIREIGGNFDFKAILLLPRISCSTKRIYANYRHDRQRFESLKSQIDTLLEKNRIDLVAGMCANMLDSACFGLHRELAELKAQVESSGIEPLCLSGSGSAMYHIIKTSDGGRLDEYLQLIKRRYGCESIIVTNNGW